MSVLLKDVLTNPHISVSAEDVLEALGWMISPERLLGSTCLKLGCWAKRSHHQRIFCDKHTAKFRVVRARLYAKDQHRKNKYGLVKKRMTYGGKPTKYALGLGKGNKR